MKNLQQRKIKKSDVLKVMLVFAFAAFFISCNNEAVEDQNAQLSNTEQQNQPNTKRYLPHYEGVIVRDWGAHNIDCSQPEGFCNFVRYIWMNGFVKPDPDGTPVRVTNEADKFVMTIQKSALTAEHKKVLLRNGEFYVIPEGQTIDPELVKSLKFNSDILVPGKCRIVESEETYTISINVNENK